MSDPTIRERLRELAERHRLSGERLFNGGVEFCAGCNQSWPCDFTFAYADLDTLERRAIAAESALEAVVAEPMWANWGTGNRALDLARSVLEEQR